MTTGTMKGNAAWGVAQIIRAKDLDAALAVAQHVFPGMPEETVKALYDGCEFHTHEDQIYFDVV